MGVEKMMAICPPPLMILVLESPSYLHIFIVKVKNIVPYLCTVLQSLLAEISGDPVVFCLFGRRVG